jgi:hypothetical protein
MLLTLLTLLPLFQEIEKTKRNGESALRAREEEFHSIKAQDQSKIAELQSRLSSAEAHQRDLQERLQRSQGADEDHGIIQSLESVSFLFENRVQGKMSLTY